MKLEHYYHLVNKKLTGEINPAEEIELLNWVQESPANELYFRRMMDAWKKGQYSIRIKGQQATFNKISRQLDFEENIFSDKNCDSSPDIRRRWYRVAVVFIFLLTAIGIFYFNISTPDGDTEVVQSKMIIKNNPAGQKTGINLPDGSVCWLNSESGIKYLSNYTDSTRDIYLKGEAYFEVAKDPARPFRVYTTTMTVTALGTIFNISSFSDDKKETVALIEGRISVNCEDNFYNEILPGEAISYDKGLRTSDRIKVDPYDAISWKDGVLSFDEETYQTIFAKLERWYGVKITIVGDYPKGLKYRASFKNELLVNILESIRYGRDFKYLVDGKNIKIMFNKNDKNI